MTNPVESTLNTAEVTLTGFLLARIDEDEAVAGEATPGPWSYDSYSTVYSGPMSTAHDEFWDETRETDEHTYDNRVGQTCPACGERPAIYGEDALPEFRGVRFGTYWDCARHGEAYEVEPWAARVPALMGDTARGRHAATAEHIARHDPARVLAECEAKRRIVGEHERIFWGETDGNRHGAGCSSCRAWRRYPERGRAWVEPVDFPCPTLRALAAVYSYHPDYREDWRL